MNHSFLKSITNELLCAVCHREEIMHTDKATCECCPNIGTVNIAYGGIAMCSDCENKEKELQRVNNTPEKQQKRINHMNSAIEASRALDSKIAVRSDIFNAATTSIIELKATIDNDESITNKPYELAKVLTERFNHFKQVVFEMNEKIIEAGNNQKAIQVYLNNLANQLRAEEREKLKISDINYKPTPPKSTQPKAIKINPKKFDKAELKKYAAELGVNEATLQMLVVAKGITVEAAANLLRKSINEAKSE